jgi:hypothetical protein
MRAEWTFAPCRPVLPRRPVRILQHMWGCMATVRLRRCGNRTDQGSMAGVVGRMARTTSGSLADRIGCKTPLMIFDPLVLHIQSYCRFFPACGFCSSSEPCSGTAWERSGRPAHRLRWNRSPSVHGIHDRRAADSWSIGFLLSKAAYGWLHSSMGWHGMLMPACVGRRIGSPLREGARGPATEPPVATAARKGGPCTAVRHFQT